MPEDLGWIQNLNGLPAGYGSVRPNDPRIPPPAKDAVIVDPETERLLVVAREGSVSAPKSTEDDDMPKVKASIYSAKGDLFVFSVDDMSGDPIEQVRAEAEVIANIVKPLFEAADIKVIDRSGGDFKEALAAKKKPTQLRAAKAS